MTTSICQGEIVEQDEIIKLINTQIKAKAERSENYREITQDRIFAGIREGYFVYVIQNEVFDTNKQENFEEKNFVDEVQVKVSPQQMVKMHKLFGQLIKNYEEVYGEIKTIEQIVIEKPELMKNHPSRS
ncbi:hypothetical protein MSSAC_1338 [Methanosarcina siciliae C2J]|uniref:Uncharacterized protein n=2 Tax=Methanosarcina siciliae TaxID=38027 RepID=A0A0E3PN53_9EURY|nr:hypothetical protein MSSAC_1338 [Methanosarcina siciliae C2J]